MTSAPDCSSPTITTSSLTDSSSDFEYVTDCPVGGYLVSVKVPSPSYVNVDPSRAVQVTVRQAQVPMTLARLFGQNTWNVGQTSVAGLRWVPQYALLTLRPPNVLPSLLDQNRDDIDLAGTNTRVNILQGDVGTNSYVVTNSASYMSLASGYLIYHHDDITPDGWNQVNGLPAGHYNAGLIPDPNYVYPSGISLPTPQLTGYNEWPTQGSGVTDCPSGVPSTAWSTALGVSVSTWTCYQPGVYEAHKAFTVGTGEAAYLLPGIYWFQSGVSVGGTLAGGLASGEGVDLYFTESNTNTLSALNTENLLLNMGDRGCVATLSSPCVTPAVDPSGKPMQTPAGYLLTIEVARDPSCFGGSTGTTPQLCTDNQNRTVNIGGNGLFEVAGVIYGPSDKMQVNSNSTVQTGNVGQIIAWQVTYGGGPLLAQTYPGVPGNGIMSLDAACSGPIGFGFGGVGSGGTHFCNP